MVCPINSSRIFRTAKRLLYRLYVVYFIGDIMYIDDTAKEKFSNQVLQRVSKTKLSFMDCVLELSEEMGLEPSAAGKLLTKPIIEKIEQEGKRLNILKNKKTTKLPVD
jgi:hypothetical protein